MKNLVFIPILISVLMLNFSCKKNKENQNQNKQISAESMKDNPLIQESTLPYFAPDFSKIKEEHFQPALDYALQIQKTKIDSIANQTPEPTFENTLVEMEKSGVLIGRVRNVFSALTGAHTNDNLKAIQTEMAPKFAAHSDAIKLNDKLFQRIKTLYDKKDELGLQGEDLKLLEVTYEDFLKDGANLSEENKSRLKEINAELATLQNDFNQKLLNANNASALIIKDTTELAGLSTGEIKSKKVEGKDEWKLPIQNTTQQPLNQSLNNRDLREELFLTAWNRTESGEFATGAIIQKMVKLRAEKAKLLGYENYAAWNLQDTMVETPETVRDFFNQIAPAAAAKAKNEEAELTKLLNKSGDSLKLNAWDWGFYSEKMRKEKYDLDESEIKPYFELKTVLEDGVFFAATKLYGITFKERTDIPTYHPDVLVYELFEEDGSELGLFYGDFFARESKRGGAWMSNLVTQSHLMNKKPVIFNVCNYTKPAEDEPALITFDEVNTLFHEFGHALHGFFANQKYPSLSGTSVARDFVEFPSQVNEHWVLYPEVLKNYAKHYETGEQIPQSLIDKIKNADTFNQGFALTEVLAAADLDFNYHTLNTVEDNLDINKFEQESLSSHGLWLENVPPRYRSTYFSHIFGGGYAAGYYAYLWTEMLALDTGKWFDENGGLNRENGNRYREMILSKGNTLEYKEAYNAFRGSDPKIEAMIKARGLN